MAEIVLYHHSQGLTDGVKAFAEPGGEHARELAHHESPWRFSTPGSGFIDPMCERDPHVIAPSITKLRRQGTECEAIGSRPPWFVMRVRWRHVPSGISRAARAAATSSAMRRASTVAARRPSAVMA